MTAEKLKELLDSGEVITLGANTADAGNGIIFSDGDYYGSTEYQADKEDGKYAVIPTYYSHHGDDELAEDEIELFDTFEEFLDYIKALDLDDFVLEESLSGSKKLSMQEALHVLRRIV